MTQKYEKERRQFEDEKQRKQQDIQSSIDRLNVPSGEKEQMRRELENLSHEQRLLQQKIDDLEREVEAERTKKRAAERELNELNISINQKKLLGGQESSKVQWLRDEIVKKNTQLSAANREYKQVLETRTENVISGQAPRSAYADTTHINKLESEITDIKSMLNEYGIRSSERQTRISHLLADDNEENMQHNDSSSKDFVREQKQAIKD